MSISNKNGGCWALDVCLGHGPGRAAETDADASLIRWRPFPNAALLRGPHLQHLPEEGELWAGGKSRGTVSQQTTERKEGEKGRGSEKATGATYILPRRRGESHTEFFPRILKFWDENSQKNCRARRLRAVALSFWRKALTPQFLVYFHSERHRRTAAARRAPAPLHLCPFVLTFFMCSLKFHGSQKGC